MLEYFVKGFHEEMFFNKKYIEAVEGNKLVDNCEFGKTRNNVFSACDHARSDLAHLPPLQATPAPHLSSSVPEHRLAGMTGNGCDFHVTTEGRWGRKHQYNSMTRNAAPKECSVCGKSTS